MPKDAKPTAPVKNARKRPGRRPRELPTWYVVAVEGWEWSYSFGIQRMKDRPEPYDDYRHLHLTGTLLRPSKLKVETVRLIFLPDEAYNRDQWDRHKRPMSAPSASIAENSRRCAHCPPTRWRRS